MFREMLEEVLIQYIILKVMETVDLEAVTLAALVVVVVILVVAALLVTGNFL